MASSAQRHAAGKEEGQGEADRLLAELRPIVHEYNEEPLYRRIASHLAARVRSGSLPEGFRLPPVRTLARELGVAVVTAHTAYTELARQGLVERVPRRGTRVKASRPKNPEASVPPPPLPAGDGPPPRPVYLRADSFREQVSAVLESRPGLCSFAGGYPDVSLQPRKALEQALRRVLRDAGAGFLQACPPQGHPGLLELAAAYLHETLGVEVPAREIMIATGTQQVLDLVARTFVGPGDRVACEAPTFPGALDALRARQVRWLPVPVDRHGMRVDLLEAAGRADPPRLIYVIPNHHNPTGVTLSAERREHLLALARRWDALILEDDPYGEWHGGDRPPPALRAQDRDGRVILAKGLSKTAAPGLRLGLAVVPGRLLPALVEAKAMADLFSPTLPQVVLAEFLAAGAWRGPLARSRREIARRRRALLDGLAPLGREGWSWFEPAGGTTLWVTLPPTTSARLLAAHAARLGVLVLPGHLFFPADPPDRHLRLSFSQASLEAIAHGLARLRGALAALGEYAAPQPATMPLPPV